MTPLQRRCLDAIKRLTVDGMSPSYEEIGAEIGIGSRSGVYRIVHDLARIGCLSIDPGRSRGIVIVAENPAYTQIALEALGTDALAKLAATAASIVEDRRRRAA